MNIYRVEDGSTWHFAAESPQAARKQWVDACIGIHGNKDEAELLEEFGEPTVSLVPLVQAAMIQVVDDEKTECCPTCSGRGRVPRKATLLDWFREDQQLPPEKRAKYGALCNSEWP